MREQNYPDLKNYIIGNCELPDIQKLLTEMSQNLQPRIACICREDIFEILNHACLVKIIRTS